VLFENSSMAAVRAEFIQQAKFSRLKPPLFGGKETSLFTSLGEF